MRRLHAAQPSRYSLLSLSFGALSNEDTFSLSQPEHKEKEGFLYFQPSGKPPKHSQLVGLTEPMLPRLPLWKRIGIAVGFASVALVCTIVSIQFDSYKPLWLLGCVLIIALVSFTICVDVPDAAGDCPFARSDCLNIHCIIACYLCVPAATLYGIRDRSRPFPATKDEKCADFLFYHDCCKSIRSHRGD
jgi:hypothetical protein